MLPLFRNKAKKYCGTGTNDKFAVSGLRLFDQQKDTGNASRTLALAGRIYLLDMSIFKIEITNNAEEM